MIDILFFIDMILFIISIFALAFFCAVIPKTSIAQYFYILFGVTAIPVGIRFILEDYPWYVCIWAFVFAIVAIIVGICLIKANRKMTRERQKQLNQDFGEMARRGGKRRACKELWKMNK